MTFSTLQFAVRRLACIGLLFSLTGTALNAAAASTEDLARVQEKLQLAAAPWCERLAKLDEQGRRRCLVQARNMDLTGVSNAFAFLGNASISQDLLAVLTEDELALLMGHEFAHLVLGHAVVALRRISQSQADTATLLSLVESSNAPPHEDTPEDPRRREHDADKLGLYLAGLAGYRVGQMAPLWRDAAKRIPGWERSRTGVTHPHNAQREQAARVNAREFCEQLRSKRTLMPVEPRLQPRYELSVDELRSFQAAADLTQVCLAGARR